MPFPRACGVLLHPTSLPGRFGIGDLGAEAYHFVDFLDAAGQSLWQILPLGPTGYGDSPYQCFSAFAGNPLLISLERLVEEGALSDNEIADPPAFPLDAVDFGPVISYKIGLLQRAAGRFLSQAPRQQRGQFLDFCDAEAGWLTDYTLFMALKAAHGGAAWVDWEPELAQRRPEALARAREALAGPILAHQFMQFQFFRQWSSLKRYANERGIRIIGDVPIFVAHDSADVWAHPELFYLDAAGRPTVVAGVPPDYFSAAGQLWGNPLYRWEDMARDGFAWWIERVRAALRLMDILRLDHFRGFEAYWEVPAHETTAVNGRWIKGPGAPLFQSIAAALGSLPIIAEDLGVITPAVEALRDQFAFPGMRVLQFGFSSDASNIHLPHHWLRNSVVYSGTHDNDTAAGWYQRVAGAPEGDYARRYLAIDGHDIAWDLLRAVLASVADQALYPAQDLLSLGNAARMNYPSRPSGNWAWRVRAGALDARIAGRLRQMAYDYGRLPSERSEQA